MPAGLDLDQVFRLETERTVGHDWAVRHENRLLQLERRGRYYPPAPSTVLVCEYEDGHLEVWHRGARVPCTDITGMAARVTSPPPAPSQAPVRQAPGARRVPARTHPWRQRYQGLHDAVSPGESIPGRPGARLRPPAASAGPPAQRGACSAAASLNPIDGDISIEGRKGTFLSSVDMLASHVAGMIDGAQIRFRFSPRDAKVWPYAIESDVSALQGRKGEFTAVLAPSARTARPDPAHPNWWTDDPDPAAAEGVHRGARTVSQWRVEFLRDFAMRLERCRAR